MFTCSIIVDMSTGGLDCSQWENQDPDNAFFHKSHFVERPEDFQEHPTPEMPLPRDWNASQFWIHQSTRCSQSFGVASELLGIAVPKNNLARCTNIIVCSWQGSHLRSPLLRVVHG